MKYMVKMIISLVFVILIILSFNYFKISENFTVSSTAIDSKTDDGLHNKQDKNTTQKIISGSGVNYNASDLEKGSGFTYNKVYDKKNDSMYLPTQKSNSSDIVGSGDTLYAYDKNGNLVQVPYENVKGMISYYEPGNYQFNENENTYSASKETTNFSSILTGETEYTEVKGTPSQMGGICKNYKNNPELLEQACNSLDNTVCASTDCCVLLGGSKCVSGDKKGPVMRSNYSDILLRNKDFYYHKGDCYGNCVNEPHKDSEVEKPKEEINVNMPDKININVNLDSAFSKNTGNYNNYPDIKGSVSGGSPNYYRTPNDVNNVQYGYTYNANAKTQNNDLSISYNVNGDWHNISDTWNKLQNNFFGHTEYKDSGFDIYNPDYTASSISSAITQLKQTPPNTNNSIDFIATAISIHKNNVNNINQSLFNLNIALTNINGANRMSADVALASLKKSLKFWPSDDVISAWNKLSGSSSSIQYAIEHINNAISSHNSDLNSEKSIINALNNALNAINVTTPNVNAGIDNLNSAFSILQKWKNLSLNSNANIGSSRFTTTAIPPSNQITNVDNTIRGSSNNTAPAVIRGSSATKS